MFTASHKKQVFILNIFFFCILYFMGKFKLKTDFKPSGDQPKAIDELVEGIKSGEKIQVLLGATGTGKTFTMANVIEKTNRPTLIMCHNKTLAAQLYGEFKQFFPENAVEYFISFYDYYQPEAYLPTTDTFIEKDSSINDEIDRLRLKATSALLERRDVVIVASVSAIYGLGSPEIYSKSMFMVEVGEELDRKKFFQKLVDIMYTRNDFEFQRGTFRVRGDIVEIFPAYETEAIRISFFGDEVERIEIVEPLTGKIIVEKNKAAIFPAKHFLSTEESLEYAMKGIREELDLRLKKYEKENKPLEAQRIKQRTNYDLDMLLTIGYCSGIENYSRFLDMRQEGQRPYCLFDFFPDDYLVMIDESHQTLPQIRGMYAGDRSRKETLVEHGFRLPSALDNRPLKFYEFEGLINQAIYISATPSEYELEQTGGVFVEQIIRPTGLLDPEIEIRPVTNQVDDLVDEIRKTVAKGERVLATTLTKRMSEDLTDYLKDLKLNVKYLHSDIDAIERVELLRDLRLGKFDVLVGINLLREGLDMPEVSLVAILDADKEGFLRSRVSLLQTIGRAARNDHGRVILYANKVTASIRVAIEETNRRRQKQIEHNSRYNVIPKTVTKTKEQIINSTSIADVIKKANKANDEEEIRPELPDEVFSLAEPQEKIVFLEKEMKKAAKELQFEKAALIRDEIAKIKETIYVGQKKS
jgi:excinuclease ABC subunit B